MNKLWPLIATSLVAFTVLSAADASSGSMKQGSTKKDMNNPNGGVQGGYDLSIGAAALLWKPQQGGTEFATNGNANRHVQQVGPDYDWGFRVDLGYTMPHDRWNVTATWDHLHTGGGESTGAGWIGFGALQGLPGGTLTGAAGNAITLGSAGTADVSSHWHLAYDAVDLALKRDFQFSKWVCVAPHVGLRSAWIDQKQEFNFNRNTADSAALHSKNDFWGLGIRAGFDTNWGLGRGWSIYGNAAAALLYGNYHVNSVEHVGTFATTSGTRWTGHNTFHTSRASGDFMLGLRWNHMFSDNRYGLTLQVGYEQHIYWNLFEATQPGAQALNGDLTFVGWTGAARFDF